MKNKNTQQLTLLAIFLSLIILLGMTPIGLINLGFTYVTILSVPVIIGTIILGRKQGLLLGACFGLLSFYTAMTKPSALASPIVAASIPATLALCLLPRLLIPLVTDLTYTRLKRTKTSVALSAVLGSLTNTVFYLGMLVLMYAILGLDAAAILGTIIGIAALAGSAEAIVAGIITVPIVMALLKLYKRKDIHS